MRNIKTEYVSCPSCGRTLFDLQLVTEEISKATGLLPPPLFSPLSPFPFPLSPFPSPLFPLLSPRFPLPSPLTFPFLFALAPLSTPHPSQAILLHRWPSIPMDLGGDR